MDCRSLGVPYIAARQEDSDETYKPANSRTLTADTFSVIMKSVNSTSRVQVAPKNRINTKYIKVAVATWKKIELHIR